MRLRMNSQQTPGQNKRSSQLLEIDPPAPYFPGEAFPPILDARLGPNILNVPLSDSDSDRVQQPRSSCEGEASTTEYSVLSVYEDELQSGDTVDDPNEVSRLNLRLSLTAVPAVGGQRHAYLMNFGGLATTDSERVIQYASGTEEWRAMHAMNELLGEFSARHAEIAARLQQAAGRLQNGALCAASQPVRAKSHLQTPPPFLQAQRDASAGSPPDLAVERRHPTTAQQKSEKYTERNLQSPEQAACSTRQALQGRANEEQQKFSHAKQHYHATDNDLGVLDNALERSGSRFCGADAEGAARPGQASPNSASGCVQDSSEDP